MSRGHDEERALEAGRSVAPPSPATYPVLLVEDDCAISRLIVRALTDQGHDVTAVPTAEEGLARLAFLPPAILVADVRLPGMDGIELVGQVSALRDDVEVILVTAHPDFDALTRAVQLGIFRCLRKPFRLDDLIAVVNGASNRLFLRLDRRRRTEELERRNAELHETVERLRHSEHRRVVAERLASMGQFAAALGHEINNPLAYVQTGLDLIRRGVGREQQDKILDDCDAGLKLMRQISADLGSVASYRSESATLFDLNEVTRTACRIARVNAGGSTRVLLELAPDGVAVRGSAGRVAQVVMNLVTNAIEATDPARPNTIVVRTGEAGGQATIAVSDTGVGVAVDRREVIFDPFVTFRADAGGSGIGLGVVRHIATELGGTVTVDSEPGVGSTFVVRFPAARRTVGERSLRRSSGPPPPGIRVLFVDDDVLLRRSLVRGLGAHDARAAGTGEEALAAIEDEVPDVVITDCDIEDMNGAELYERIVARWPELAARVLFITGQRSPRLPRPDVPVLHKPFGLDELRAAIEGIVGPAGPGARPQSP